MKQMENGRGVEFRLHGDETWYTGVIVCPRKERIKLSKESKEKLRFELADETNISEWKYLDD